MNPHIPQRPQTTVADIAAQKAAESQSNFYQQAGKAALASPLIAVVFKHLLTSGPAKRGGEAVALAITVEFAFALLLVIGLVAGIVSISGACTGKGKGLLVPGIMGVAVNGLIAVLLTNSFLAARETVRIGRLAQEAVNEYTADLNERFEIFNHDILVAREPTPWDVSDIDSLEALRTRKTQARQSYNIAIEFKDYLGKLEQHLEDKFRDRNLPETLIQNQLTEFRESSASVGDMAGFVGLREVRLETCVTNMYDILEREWGDWKPAPNSGEPVFANEQAQSDFFKLVKEAKYLFKQQLEIQKVAGSR